MIPLPGAYILQDIETMFSLPHRHPLSIQEQLPLLQVLLQLRFGPCTKIQLCESIAFLSYMVLWVEFTQTK